MDFATCFQVGKIVRKHSFRGEVIILINSDYAEIISETESVFIALGDNLVPFFMDKWNWQKNLQLRVKFEDVDTEMDADAIVNRKVYLPNTFLPELEGNDYYKDEIIGFSVKDINYGLLGVVRSINDKTPQTLLEVENEEGVVLIPVDAFVKEIDRENNTIIVATPEGLIDLRL